MNEIMAGLLHEAVRSQELEFIERNTRLVSRGRAQIFRDSSDIFPFEVFPREGLIFHLDHAPLIGEVTLSVHDCGTSDARVISFDGLILLYQRLSATRFLRLRI